MPKRLTDLERYHRSIPEKHLQEQILDAARMFGWLAFHHHDSRRQVTGRGGEKIWVGDKDAKGFPDVCMVHPKHSIAFIEVKREQGRLEPEQVEWLDALIGAGIPAVVMRPSTWTEIMGFVKGGFPEVGELLGFR